jgi:hypothetical protein
MRLHLPEVLAHAGRTRTAGLCSATLGGKKRIGILVR